MNELVIDQLDEDVWAGLQRLAADRGQPLPDVVRDVLRRAVRATAVHQPPNAGPAGLGSLLVAAFAGCGPDEGFPELRGKIKPQNPTFDP